MQSKNLQYTRPDENVKGGKNKGIVAQYPYFAPDQGYLKKAPKMTKADELYLKKFMQARADAEIVKEEETILAQKRQRAMNKEDQEDIWGPGKINQTINIRLLEERKLRLKNQIMNRGKSTDKVTITNEIFGEKKYFQQTEDTTKNSKMQKYVHDQWESQTVLLKDPATGKSPERSPEVKGKTGNVVPFFPTDWKLNANDVFNMILNGEEPNEDVYDDVTHAAVHRKAPDG